MYLNPTFQSPAFSGLSGLDNQQIARNQLGNQFGRARRQARWHNFFDRVQGRCRCLLDLNDIEHSVPLNARHYAGIQIVPIASIRGSEGREDDFDADFNPLQAHNRERWISVASAHQRGIPLPPVELIKIGDIYYVRDGHHRVSVAKLMDQVEIEAEVTVWEMRQAA